MDIKNFNLIFGNVSKNKIDEIKNKINELDIDLNDIEEKFVKGSGCGGQKINKTSNRVILKYKPLNIIVKCQKERSLSVNRFIALRTLLEKIEKNIKERSDLIFKHKRRCSMILEGKTLAEEINKETKKIAEEIALKKRRPRLAIINYFENSPSSYYMNLKIKKCQSLGIETKLYIPENRNKKDFIDLIKKLNDDKSVDAIMVEKPLPEGFDDIEFWDTLNPDKDVDALSSLNMGRLFISRGFDEIEKGSFFVPQTAYAVIKLIKHYNIEVSGKRVVVLGRSSIIGKPVAHMLNLLDATVTICHSKTKDLDYFLKTCDIIVTAIGRARFVKENMIGEGQYIIDVGTNFDENGRSCGDVDFDNVLKKAKGVTPVPGGVGPVTLANLLNATVKAARNLL